MSNFHSGQVKSGPWLLEASYHYAEMDHDDPLAGDQNTFHPRSDDKQDAAELTASIYAGRPKSGPWLLEASRHEADVAVRPGVTPPGGRAAPVQSAPAPTPQAPAQVPDEPWVKEDWRNGNGGAFHSNVRPKMTSDVPHPSEVLNPANKRQNATLQRLSQAQDPEHDPWGVLDGSGQTFENLVNNHMGHMSQASPEQNYEGRVWYRAAHEGTKDLAEKTTGDHGRTVATISAFSPKTGWDENVEKGHHFLTHYDGSDPSFTIPGLQDHVEKAKAIYHAPGDEYKNVVTGPKTSAFAHNILDPSPLREPRPGEHDDAGYYQHAQNPHTGEADWRLNPDQDATMDTHHVRMSNTTPGQSLGGMKYEVPPYFGKKISVNGQKFDPSYDLQARANWEATRRLNAQQADPERHLLPKQSQAIAWTKFKHDVDHDPDSNKHIQPEPGQAPKGKLGPLTNPIPRYQKERDPEWWDDPRRPKVDLRQTPNWHHRKPAHVANTANNGTVWGKMLGGYIARHPQHPQDAPPSVAPKAKPRRVRAPRKPGAPKTSKWYVDSSVSKWYITADSDVDGKDLDSLGGGMASGGISGGGQMGATPSVANGGMMDWSGMPNAAPMTIPSMPSSGGGGSRPMAPSPSGGSGYSGPAGGGAPTGGPPSQSLTEALTRAGIDPSMHALISGFSATEGNNPSGAPTLGFTDGQAGTTLDQHAQALAKQLNDRQSVAGPFPHGGSPEQQASWMATVVGQNGSASDWQGNHQPARSTYVNNIVKSMPGQAPAAPTAVAPHG